MTLLAHRDPAGRTHWAALTRRDGNDARHQALPGSGLERPGVPGADQAAPRICGWSVHPVTFVLTCGTQSCS
jgi:hypothetical protein